MTTNKRLDRGRGTRLGARERGRRGQRARRPRRRGGRVYAELPTRGIALTKQLFDHGDTATLEEQLALEARLQQEATQTADFAEGVTAFAEKRPPKFTGS